MATNSLARPSLWSIRGPMSQRRYLPFAAIGLVTPLVAWWLLANSGWVEKVFMPGPVHVWDRAVLWFTEDELIRHRHQPLSRGRRLGFSALIAIPLGL